MTPEGKLWRAVVLQALTDALATGDSLTILSKAEKKEAINYYHGAIIFNQTSLLPIIIKEMP